MRFRKTRRPMKRRRFSRPRRMMKKRRVRGIRIGYRF